MTSLHPYALLPNTTEFPPVEQALSEPNGLLAIGGDLKPQRLIAAYRQGIFPWYTLGSPLLWWSPDPRCVLRFEDFKLSRSLQKNLRNKAYRVTFDQAFREVMQACAAPREGQDDSWITQAMLDAYYRLHQSGVAHSVEVWDGEHLIGGLYGISTGRVFCGESMFSKVTDASKIALAILVEKLQEWDYCLIDCQITNKHLTRMGASNMPRIEFVRLLCEERDKLTVPEAWKSTPS